MTYDEERTEMFEPNHEAEAAARKMRSDRPILAELIKVLTPNPGGLRRWSVMRAIRNDRDRAGRDIPQKFEDEVERVFRRFCADMTDSRTRACSADDALFFRPEGKAGEVWAVYPERSSAWLESDAD